MAEEWQLDYNTERPHKSLDIFLRSNMRTVLPSRVKEPKLYPQTANEILPKLKGAVSG